MTETVLDVVQRNPGITISQLAERLGIEPAMLAALREGLVRVVDDRHDAEDPGVVARWGASPSAGELKRTQAIGETARREALDSVLTGALSRDHAAERLGVSAQAISERRKAGTLTALRRGREWRFPAWQFADDGTLPELKGLIAAWPGSALSLSTWAVRPSSDLQGRTPAQQLARRGGAARVLELVQAIGAAGW